MHAMKSNFFGAAGVALFCFALALSGCNSSPNVMMGDETVAGGVATNLLIANPSLQKKIAITDANSRRVNDLLNVSIQLISAKKKTVSFEHRFQWFDAAGFEISDPKAHWAPVMIYGGDRLLVQQIAPNSQAVTFKLQVRESDPVKR